MAKKKKCVNHDWSTREISLNDMFDFTEECLFVSVKCLECGAKGREIWYYDSTEEIKEKKKK